MTFQQELVPIMRSALKESHKQLQAVHNVTQVNTELLIVQKQKVSAHVDLLLEKVTIRKE